MPINEIYYMNETEVLKEMRWGKWETFAFNYADYSMPTFELPSF